jgi:hypothetical protein
MVDHIRKRFPIIGVILIVIGVALLLHEMEVINIGAGTLVWIGVFAYGAATIIRAFIVNERGKIFWGTLCYLTGLLFLLKKFGFLHESFSLYFPAFILIVGLSFFMLFVFNIRDWHLLIPSFIFLAVGAALMLTQMGYWYTRDVWNVIRSYWPVLLILLGGVMILRKRQY